MAAAALLFAALCAPSASATVVWDVVIVQWGEDSLFVGLCPPHWAAGPFGNAPDLQGGIIIYVPAPGFSSQHEVIEESGISSGNVEVGYKTQGDC